MKPLSNNSLDGLLRAARRRWVFRRAVEAAAVGASIACGAGLLVIAILWWQSESSINLIAGLIACGALLGATMSLIARPSAMQTAKRLDEHHKLHDLLATAQYLIEAQREDEFRNEIIRHANIVAAEIRLTPMMFARLSAPQKTAMVGLIGMTLTAAAIASSHVERNESAFRQERGIVNAPSAGSRKENLEKGTTENRHLASAADEYQTRATSVKSGKIDGAGRALTNSESRDGNSFAKTEAKQTPVTSVPRANASTSINRDIASSGGANGNSGSVPAGPGASANTSVNARPVAISSDSRDAALKLLSNGGVPDAYSDLVRDYFLRD